MYDFGARFTGKKPRDNDDAKAGASRRHFLKAGAALSAGAVLGYVPTTRAAQSITVTGEHQLHAARAHLRSHK
ncbi:twin-arginine translocation signal domain-containing protein [Paraburkholderia acidiphila]|uniref:Twin-arginine translocation signal domain-containing protein n=1 Tax=Paraburkholderia acidiphila TaxID=2571747 RepID=A0A7Z2G705_9BURK|nr:twin-arginine translocation signal domain-containing protein [Paraburkholderia acidiphila]